MKITKLGNSKKNINIVAHISDIHVRPYKRHTEYKLVFDKLYKSLKEKHVELAVITGDIVHAKTEMSPELISVVSNFFISISDIVPTIIIPGNHDANLNNLNRLDALSPIISNLSSHNIFYLIESGIYSYSNLNFVHMSVFDSFDKYIHSNDIKTLTPKIALFHGTVNNSTNDFGFLLKNDDIGNNIFSGYDITMLGDIHKQQFLNKEKTIAYPGSLIQQNFGESLDKGYLIWDIKNKKSKFIKIENDFGFYTMEIKNGIVPDIKDMPIKCKLRLKIYDSSNSEIQDIVGLIKNKYKPYELTINKINSTNIITENNIKKIDIGNIHDIQYQTDLILDHLSHQYDVSNEIKHNIIQINKDLNNKIEIEEIVGNIKWKPLLFKWNNMFSYGENNYVKFENMKGIIGVFAPNTAGKSALIDSLSFNLFDKASKDFKPINIMNNRSDYFDCQIDFELNNIVYHIYRHIYKNKKGDPMYKVKFWKNQDGEDYSLNGENRWDTNKNIKSKIGAFDDFLLTSFSVQDNNNGFINRGNSERKDLIIQFIGLQVFDLLYDEASSEIKTISSKLKLLQSEDWDNKLLLIEQDYNNKKNIYDSEKENQYTLQKNKQYISDLIYKLTASLKPVDDGLDITELLKVQDNLIKSIENKKNNLTNIRQFISDKEQKIEDYNYNISLYENMNINSLYDDLCKLKDNRTDTQNEINKLKIVVSNKLEKMKNLVNLEYDENCKYCMNNIFVKDAISVKLELQQDETKANEMVLKLDSLDEIIKSKLSIEEEHSNYKEILKNKNTDEIELNKLKVNESKVYFDLVEFESKLSICKNDISNYYKNEKNIIFNNDVHDKIKSESIKLDEVNSELDIVNENLLEYYSDLKTIGIEKENTLEKIVELKDTLIIHDSYKYYIDSIQRNGVPCDIIAKILPTVESEINDILHQIVDFSILIELDENKNINIFIVYDDNNYWPLELASGMEKFISSIAIRVALTNVSNLPRPNFLIIDEGWGKLDSDNLNSVSMLLDYLKTQFEFIIIISHIEQMKDVADTLIEIKKDETGHSVVQHN